MGNPFLSPAPMDPRGGFGFPRPPVRPFKPKIGGGNDGFDLGSIDTPLGRARICMPGSQCDGPSVPGPFGTSACLGNCVSVAHPPADPLLPPTTPVPFDPAMPLGRVIGVKRKRMNYSNQKALRRALRRATGYARQQKSIRKAAGEFAREFGPKSRRARRDVPPGHGHVR